MGFPSGIWCGGFGRQRIDVGFEGWSLLLLLLECLVKMIIMAVVVVAVGGGVMACRMWVRDDRKRSMRRGFLEMRSSISRPRLIDRQYCHWAMMPTISMVRRCIDGTIGKNGSEGRRGGHALDLNASGHVEFGNAMHSRRQWREVIKPMLSAL